MAEEKLTYLMRSMLRDLERAGARGIRRSNTNKTLVALERRGMITGAVIPTSPLEFQWRITEVGIKELRK